MMMEIYSTQMAVAQRRCSRLVLLTGYRPIGITNQRGDHYCSGQRDREGRFIMRLCGNAEGLQTPLNGLENRDIPI